jgi:hypothetical protein
MAIALGIALAVANASTATRGDSAVAKYRSTLNAYCQATTVKLAGFQKKIDAAVKAMDGPMTWKYLGLVIGHDLAETHMIVATPVPSSLRAKMAPALRILRRGATLERRFFALARDPATPKQVIIDLGTELGKLDVPVNRALDRAGLQECGSRQTF